ncbi:MAG TPA: hypothetical protein P5200_01030 [Tenuifilaceae bacterium]|nr:hypothetical protein [Tenuifilaceae bacterium]
MERVKKLLFLGFFVLINLTINRCTCKREPKIPLNEIDVEVKVQRFDRDLFSINSENIQDEIGRLDAKYPDFFRLFTEGIIGIGLPEQPEFASYLNSFVTDNMVAEAYKDVQKTFPNTDELNQTLTNAFKRYRYYFPGKPIPSVYGFVSGFNNSVVLADSILGVGFDRYLGRNYPSYPRLGVYNYISYNMHPKKIPSDLMRSWAIGEFHFNDSIDNLLNNMMYEGMLMYFTKRMLPDQPDSLIFGFSPDQMRWCQRNEKEMWSYMVEHKLLFNTDAFTIRKFVDDAPFTHNFPKESPGRAAVWIGYRIVNRYMNRNENVTLSELMEERDYQKILNQSKYNP